MGAPGVDVLSVTSCSFGFQSVGARVLSRRSVRQEQWFMQIALWFSFVSKV